MAEDSNLLQAFFSSLQLPSPPPPDQVHSFQVLASIYSHQVNILAPVKSRALNSIRFLQIRNAISSMIRHVVVHELQAIFRQYSYEVMQIVQSSMTSFFATTQQHNTISPSVIASTRSTIIRLVAYILTIHLHSALKKLGQFSWGGYLAPVIHSFPSGFSPIISRCSQNNLLAEQSSNGSTSSCSPVSDLLLKGSTTRYIQVNNEQFALASSSWPLLTAPASFYSCLNPTVNDPFAQPFICDHTALISTFIASPVECNDSCDVQNPISTKPLPETTLSSQFVSSPIPPPFFPFNSHLISSPQSVASASTHTQTNEHINAMIVRKSALFSHNMYFRDVLAESWLGLNHHEESPSSKPNSFVYHLHLDQLAQALQINQYFLHILGLAHILSFEHESSSSSPSSPSSPSSSSSSLNTSNPLLVFTPALSLAKKQPFEPTSLFSSTPSFPFPPHYQSSVFPDPMSVFSILPPLTISFPLAFGILPSNVRYPALISLHSSMGLLEASHFNMSRPRIANKSSQSVPPSSVSPPSVPEEPSAPPKPLSERVCARVNRQYVRFGKSAHVRNFIKKLSPPSNLQTEDDDSSTSIVESSVYTQAISDSSLPNQPSTTQPPQAVSEEAAAPGKATSVVVAKPKKKRQSAGRCFLHPYQIYLPFSLTYGDIRLICHQLAGGFAEISPSTVSSTLSTDQNTDTTDSTTEQSETPSSPAVFASNLHIPKLECSLVPVYSMWGRGLLAFGADNHRSVSANYSPPVSFPRGSLPPTSRVLYPNLTIPGIPSALTVPPPELSSQDNDHEGPEGRNDDTQDDQMKYDPETTTTAITTASTTTASTTTATTTTSQPLVNIPCNLPLIQQPIRSISLCASKTTLSTMISEHILKNISLNQSTQPHPQSIDELITSSMYTSPSSLANSFPWLPETYNFPAAYPLFIVRMCLSLFLRSGGFTAAQHNSSTVQQHQTLLSTVNTAGGSASVFPQWIVKPAGGSCGKGIHVVSHQSSIQSIISSPHAYQSHPVDLKSFFAPLLQRYGGTPVPLDTPFQPSDQPITDDSSTTAEPVTFSQFDLFSSALDLLNVSTSSEPTFCIAPITYFALRAFITQELALLSPQQPGISCTSRPDIDSSSPSNPLSLASWLQVIPPQLFCGARPAVVSVYLDPPLLFRRRKFDLRLYVCVSSFQPVVAWVHRMGLVRICTKEYQDDVVDDIKSPSEVSHNNLDDISLVENPPVAAEGTQSLTAVAAVASATAAAAPSRLSQLTNFSLNKRNKAAFIVDRHADHDGSFTASRNALRLNIGKLALPSSTQTAATDIPTEFLDQSGDNDEDEDEDDEITLIENTIDRIDQEGGNEANSHSAAIQYDSIEDDNDHDSSRFYGKCYISTMCRLLAREYNKQQQQHQQEKEEIDQKQDTCQKSSLVSPDDLCARISRLLTETTYLVCQYPALREKLHQHAAVHHHPTTSTTSTTSPSTLPHVSPLHRFADESSTQHCAGIDAENPLESLFLAMQYCTLPSVPIRQEQVVPHLRGDKYIPSSVSLLGFDVMVDIEGNPWLVEINTAPSLEYSSLLDIRTKQAVVTQVISMNSLAAGWTTLLRQHYVSQWQSLLLQSSSSLHQTNSDTMTTTIQDKLQSFVDDYSKTLSCSQLRELSPVHWPSKYLACIALMELQFQNAGGFTRICPLPAHNTNLSQRIDFFPSSQVDDCFKAWKSHPQDVCIEALQRFIQQFVGDVWNISPSYSAAASMTSLHQTLENSQEHPFFSK